MSTLMLQLVGFMLSILGTFLISSATAIDMWTIEDRAFTVVTSIYAYYGLWYSCVGTEYGSTQCRPYFTILGLPGLFQGVRALMIVAIVLGVIGVLIAIFALKCLRMGNMEDRVKATMTLTSGVMFVIAGICSIAGVSIFANLIVTNFALTTYTSPNGLGLVGSGLVGSPLTPRYTFGSALFVGWVGGGVLFIGGILLCLACRGLMPEKRYEGTAYKPATQSGIYRSEGYPKTYNSSYKAHSIDGRQSNQRFDYV
ncbi:claudin-18-like isoform X2 [Pangasianodon hypophthalmus]|uniref:claudin-18-like isoform X2 n=1 Tax=Pangasianodon hypophthalmus TaxID=310915 RepID=UPI002306FEF2|nr:claudin-18-like isoform X2 [Pangasianodon hypophthalmus]